MSVVTENIEFWWNLRSLSDIEKSLLSVFDLTKERLTEGSLTIKTEDSEINTVTSAFKIAQLIREIFCVSFSWPEIRSFSSCKINVSKTIVGYRELRIVSAKFKFESNLKSGCVTDKVTGEKEIIYIFVGPFVIYSSCLTGTFYSAEKCIDLLLNK